ncbi:hypothetical protein SmB9_16800 [Sphingosinicella microcystinivorans]|uniref:Phosphatidic acid phosphatase type 2/haloperoxidase domain-containing protein n=1 Tax=Sphingosinicella microcystinivorans TaxID=335406 RepID=A0AAD1D629_SPHMI|nr:hypothetical protein SmB9_16800 [Sphingosinicella microcystinivorans]
MIFVLHDRGRLALIGAAAVVWAAAAHFGGPASSADAALLAALHAGQIPGLATAARVVTELGGWIALTAATASAVIWLWLRQRRREALFLFLVVAGARLAAAAQKHVFARERPDVAHLVDVSSASFPSGHAANSLVTFLVLAVVLSGSRSAVGLAVAFAGCVGISRVMLGVHWPSDVLGGWAFGLAWVLAALCISDRLRPGAAIPLASPRRKG